jgi:hypothetical protein
MGMNRPTLQRSDPPPHHLADWLHQQFRARASTPPPGGPQQATPDATFWELASAADDAPRPLVFTRQEIENGKIGHAVDRLMNLSDTALSCAQNRSRMRIYIQGYEEDCADFSQFPNALHFFYDVTAQWPYWLHFLQPNADNLATLLRLTFKTVGVHRGPLFHTNALQRSDTALKTFETMTRATIQLHNTMGMPHSVTNSMGLALRNALCEVLA